MNELNKIFGGDVYVGERSNEVILYLRIENIRGMWEPPNQFVIMQIDMDKRDVHGYIFDTDLQTLKSQSHED